jgi:hypothetical protein
MEQQNINWFIWFRIESNGICTCEQSNEHTDSLKGELFLDWLSNY